MKAIKDKVTHHDPFAFPTSRTDDNLSYSPLIDEKLDIERFLFVFRHYRNLKLEPCEDQLSWRQRRNSVGPWWRCWYTDFSNFRSRSCCTELNQPSSSQNWLNIKDKGWVLFFLPSRHPEVTIIFHLTRTLILNASTYSSSSFAKLWRSYCTKYRSPNQSSFALKNFPTKIWLLTATICKDGHQLHVFISGTIFGINATHTHI